MPKTNGLQLYSCEYIMDTALQKTQFVVDRLLAPGLYILAGAPKVGKSWLALEYDSSGDSGDGKNSALKQAVQPAPKILKPL